MSYSNSDLLELVGRFPNIYRSSLDEPGARPASILPAEQDDTGWPGERG